MLKSLFNWKVLLNLLLAIGVFVGLVYLTFRWLEYHTNHGQEVPVPNVMNKSVHDAVKILEDAGLDYEVDSAAYDPKYKPLQVLKVYPSPGSRVKDGRAIQLMVNPKSWAPVAIPDVINKYSGLAFQRLEQVGLKVSDTIYEPSIQKDAVLRILFKGNPVNPGTKIPRFSLVDVVVGSGPLRNIGVPNVVGLTVKEAKMVIAKNLFELGAVNHEDGGNSDSDIVYYQDPASGDIRDQGMQIDLWASKKTPAELRSKIDELNSMYRMKVDTTLPPIRYEEVSEVEEPKIKEPAPVVHQKKEAPKTENTKPSGGTSGKTNTPAEKPKTSATPSSGTQEKPKAKKPIIN